MGSALSPQNYDRSPWNAPDQSQTLSKSPEQLAVQAGPNGSFTIIQKDQLIPPGPSQQGMIGTQKGADAKMASTLEADAPQLVPARIFDYSALHSFVEYFTSFSQQNTNEQQAAVPQNQTQYSTSDESESNFSIFQFAGSTPQTNNAHAANASSTPHGNAQNSTASANSAQPAQNTGTETTLYTTLMADANLPSLHLSKANTEFIKQEIQTLAQRMSTAEKNGETFTQASPRALLNKMLHLLGTPEDTSMSPEQKGVLYTALKQMTDVMAQTNAVAQQSLLAQLKQSTDPQTLFSILQNFSGVKDDSMLTPEQKKAIDKALKSLANEIGKANASGKPLSFLSSSDPKELQAALNKLLGIEPSIAETVTGTRQPSHGMSSGDMKALENALASISGNISSINEHTYEQNAKTLRGQNQGAITTYLNNTLLPLFPQQDAAHLSSCINTLSQAIAAGNASDPSALQSANAQTIQTYLQSLIEKQGEPLSPMMNSIIEKLSSIIANQNEQIALHTICTSTDYLCTRIALGNLVALPGASGAAIFAPTNQHTSTSTKGTSLSATSKPTHSSGTGLPNYLTMMAKAAAFMAQIRGEIAKLESLYSEQNARAKLNNLQSQTSIALEAIQLGIQQVQAADAAAKKAREKLAAEEKKAKLMQWLMPVITALVAVVSVVLTIATVGVGSPLAIALLVTTIGMCSFSIADSVTTSVTGEGILDRACNAILGGPGNGSEGDNAKRDALKAGIMFAMTAIMMIGTCGVAGAAMAGETVTESVLSIATSVASRGVMAALVITTTIVGPLLQSGLVTAAIFDVCTKCGLSKEDAMIVMMVAMLVLMMAMIAIMAKVASSGASEVTGEVGSLDDIGSEGTSSSKLDGGEVNLPGGEEGSVGSTGGVTDTVIDDTEQNSLLLSTLRTVGKKMGGVIKDPQLYVTLLNMISQIISAISSIQQGQISNEQADLKKTEGRLDKEMSQCQAAMHFLASLDHGFDQMVNAMTEDTKKIADFVASLLKLVDSMALSANAATTNLHSRGG